MSSSPQICVPWPWRSMQNSVIYEICQQRFQCHQSMQTWCEVICSYCTFITTGHQIGDIACLTVPDCQKRRNSIGPTAASSTRSAIQTSLSPLHARSSPADRRGRRACLSGQTSDHWLATVTGTLLTQWDGRRPGGQTHHTFRPQTRSERSRYRQRVCQFTEICSRGGQDNLSAEEAKKQMATIMYTFEWSWTKRHILLGPRC